jgi:dienelactone hydrolase
MEKFEDISTNWAQRMANDRQSLQRRDTENFLRTLTEITFAQRHSRWQRDYSSLENYARSVAPMRAEWAECVGLFDLAAQEDEVTLTPYFETDDFTAHWLVVPMRLNEFEVNAGQSAPVIHARALLALPKAHSGPHQLVIAQHGIGCCPERVFGLVDDGNLYKSYGRRLAEAGYAVLAPIHITEHQPRARYQRMCIMLGKTLWGLEISKLKALLDHTLARPEIKPEATGMWGISLGGAYTMFTSVLEPRIQAAICTAWFNDRLRKMIIDDPRHSCFLSTTEEHIFIPGWLRNFDDSDLISLICPRPMLIQSGRGDSIGWWPWLEDEFAAARDHYTRLGMADRLEMYMHDGGHEIDVSSGLAFLQRWLPA